MSRDLPPIIIDDESYQGSKKTNGKVAFISGGDSGIGAASAIALAKEGARIAINYLTEDADAEKISAIIKKYGSDCLILKGDIREKQVCDKLIKETTEHFGTLNILINNAGTQVQQEKLEDISEEQLEGTFRTNIFGMFFLTQAAHKHMKPDSCIINTASVTAYRGSQELIDYSATKGGIISYTRSLSQNLASKPIRVNAVAPGPVWTPLVLTSFNENKLSSFGKEQPLGRAAQPIEIAPAYVFLASRDSRYMTGQVLHINGGEIVNS